jgi:hypothetical protein
MKRLIVLNRFFYPDHSATSQILIDLMLHFAASGVDVHVITSQQLYDDPSRQLPVEAMMVGISIHRIPTTRFGRSGLAGRAVDYFSFYTSAARSRARCSHPVMSPCHDRPTSDFRHRDVGGACAASSSGSQNCIRELPARRATPHSCIFRRFRHRPIIAIDRTPF